jgi:ribosomal protein S18 acetylase RimI-like enzyme
MLPSHRLKILSLDHLSLSTLARVFNAAFEGYFVPIHFTIDTLKYKINSEDISLKLSTGVFDGSELVAFMFHGVRLSRAYNAGTGVLPTYRRQGLVSRMYEFQFRQLRQAGINEVFLEVITQNTPAIRAYEKAGFSTIRQLVCYKGKVSNSSIPKGKHISIDNIEIQDIEGLTSFWNYPPTWQHQLTSLRNTEAQIQGVGLFKDGQVVAYGIIQPKMGRILQLAVHQQFRRQGLGRLLLHSLSNIGNPHLSILNIDDADVATNKFFQALGFEIFIEQYEMRVSI